MLIALFGPSCVGKTTLARALGEHWGWPTRLCGDVVRQRARAVEVELDSLPLDEHALIDADTRDWCRSRDMGVVEGRFLDQVLASGGDIALFEIIAEPSVRGIRWSTRLGNGQGLAMVHASDASDEAFRVRAYGGQGRLRPTFQIDTSTRGIDDCLEELKGWRESLKAD